MTTDQPIVTQDPQAQRMCVWVIDSLFGSRFLRWFENPLTQTLTPVSERWLLDHNYNEGKGGFQL